MEHRLALELMHRSGCSYHQCLRAVQRLGTFETIIWLDRLGRRL